jgi:hypothetical protein
MKLQLLSSLSVITVMVLAGADLSAQAASVTFFDHDAFVSAAGNLTVIDFDDVTPGNGALSGDEYLDQGLTIVQRDGQPINVLRGEDINAGFPGNVNSQPNVISSSFFVGSANNTSDNFDFILSQQASAAGLWVGNIGSSFNKTTVIQFLDGNEQVIASETLGLGTPGLIGSRFNNRVFYGITSTIPISTIRTIEPAFDGDGITYDDIQYSPVPEPLSILGTGVALGFGAFLRNKRRVGNAT